jgi:DNA-binding transcriptional regulator LsrR (DeoR family)
MGNREIARELNVSEAAVRRALKDAVRRAGVKTFIVTVREA